MLLFKECCTLWTKMFVQKTCQLDVLLQEKHAFSSMYRFINGMQFPLKKCCANLKTALQCCKYLLQHMASLKKWCALSLEYVLILFKPDSVHLLCLWNENNNKAKKTLPLWDEQCPFWMECYLLKWNEFSKNAASFEWKCLLKNPAVVN
jgi:hypothetical protein